MYVQLNKIETTPGCSFRPEKNKLISFGNIYQPKDIFCDTNIKSINFDSDNHIASIDFKRPLNISNALTIFADTDNELISYELLRKCHLQDNIRDMAYSLKSVKDLKDIQVKSFVGMGAYALAFETTDGIVLKLTDMEHFPNGRKPASFDLPIKKSGKFQGLERKYYYYFEEKVVQDNLTQAEIRTLIKEIKSLGYRMKDYLLHYEDDDSWECVIKIEQFGRAKNGKVYLIDPGCAIETDDVYKPGGYSSLKRFLKKLLK